MRKTLESGKFRWQQLRMDLGQHLAQRLYEELQQSHQGGLDASAIRRTSRSYVAATILALLVHLSSLGLGVAGIWMLLSDWTNIAQVVVGLVLILLAWTARPRFAKPPHYLLDEASFPTIFSITRRIAIQLGAPSVSGIEASADFGAGYMATGWRQDRYVSLGAPLMAILSRDERLAVIAHELSHGANNDPLRGMFFFGAVNTVAGWAEAIRPSSIGDSGEGLSLGPLISLVAIPFELAMLAISELIYLAAKGMVLLVLRDSQRAEYLADALAASLAGSQSMITGLEKTYLFNEVDAACRRLALARSSVKLEFELAEESAATTPEAMQAHREKSISELWQVDSTHPPTAFRVSMLQTVARRDPALRLSDDEGSRFDEEVSRMIAWRQREVINRKLEATYG